MSNTLDQIAAIHEKLTRILNSTADPRVKWGLFWPLSRFIEQLLHCKINWHDPGGNYEEGMRAYLDALTTQLGDLI